MRWKYRKLLMNVNNAVEVVCRPPGRAEIRRVAVAEGEACLTAVGIDFATSDEDEARRAGKLDIRPVSGRQRGGGSSWQSVQRGAGNIESDYLNGEIALLGLLHGIPTPVNSLLQELAGRMARQKERPGALSVEEFLHQVSERTPG
jgi:2-dehydropantoate 2-reductase